MSAFLALLKRDLVLSYRQGIDAWVVVLFFLAAGILFPFAIGPEPNALMRVSTGVVLSMAALAALLSLDRLYQGDFEDGSLDLMVLGPLPLELTALAKALAHWLSTGLPLLIAAPLLALMLNAPSESYGPMLLALALATPALSLLGGLGAALTLGSRRGGILLTLLILPLYVPVLIFAAGLISRSLLLEDDPTGALLLLSGVDLGLLAITPWATAAALRQALR
ncbi:heme exporter protein CcmB [Dongia deserti]|uniref:heme exporter protein CcmB n=1 Tax=Dongia deserti TaxID=2268030 RepID=UPI000E64FA72|nr:heme exporter protein CcmB [Dongia deserti]